MEASFEINGEVLPFATTPRIRDVRLVEKVTGLKFGEYSERETDQQERIASGLQPNDPMAMIGMLVMAVSRAHPDWPDSRVTSFADNIDFTDIVTLGVDDADPPVVAAEAGSSSASSAALTDTPEKD